jgi:hypothetical protein
MISIDTVYQKVLAVANKEQRGYITPQEFNLFADQAQKEIIEQYFYDINQFGRVPGNDTEYSDILELLDEKLGALKFSSTETVSSGSFQLSTDVYRIGSIILSPNIEVEPINYNEHKLRNLSPLTQPTLKRPVYTNRSNIINIYPNTIDEVFLSYIKKPTKPQWGYVVVNGYAQYDGSSSTDFELHPLEEGNLVLKILQSSGLAMKDVGLYQAAAQEEMKDIQQEKQ